MKEEEKIIKKFKIVKIILMVAFLIIIATGAIITIKVETYKLLAKAEIEQGEIKVIKYSSNGTDIIKTIIITNKNAQMEIEQAFNKIKDTESIRGTEQDINLAIVRNIVVEFSNGYKVTLDSNNSGYGSIKVPGEVEERFIPGTSVLFKIIKKYL